MERSIIQNLDFSLFYQPHHSVFCVSITYKRPQKHQSPFSPVLRAACFSDWS